MPRIKLSPLNVYPWKTELTIRVSDLNYGAHLGYDRVLSLAHQARIQLFDSWGATELDLGDGVTGLVVQDAHVNYRGEGFLNDRLLIETAPVEVGAIAFRLTHRFSRKTDNELIALAEIGFVGFDYNRRMPGRLPTTFVDRLQGHLTTR